MAREITYTVHKLTRKQIPMCSGPDVTEWYPVSVDGYNIGLGIEKVETFNGGTVWYAVGTADYMQDDHGYRGPGLDDRNDAIDRVIALHMDEMRELYEAP